MGTSDLGRTSAPITAGIAATDAADAAVVALVDARLLCEAVGAHASCSGVVIAPRVVLTAAHCVEGLPPSAFEIFFGTSVHFEGSDGVFVGVNEIAVHPGYATDGRFDLALLRLVGDAPVTPAALAASLEDGAVGTTVRSVGFGQPSAGGDSGDKREGTLHVDAIDAIAIHLSPGPSLTCKGDSGGPAFAGPLVIGVTARGDAQCTMFSVLTRVDPFVDPFVAPFIASPGPAPITVTPNLAACSEPCALDASCSPARVCVHSGRDDVPGRCGAPSLPAGAYAGPCAKNAECGSDACVAVPFSAQRSCFCYRPCDPAARCDAASVLPALTGACATEAPPSSREVVGGGCALAPGPSGSWPLAAVLISCAIRCAARRMRAA